MDSSGGGGKGLTEGKRTALRSIRIVAKESFFGKISIAVAPGDFLK